METEVAADDAAGADDPAGAEAAKAAAAATGEGSGDRTDGPEAAGAPGATPTADPSAAAAAPGSEEPQPGVYLKAGEGVFINLPWASSSRAPVEGEVFDGEVLASAGLKVGKSLACFASICSLRDLRPPPNRKGPGPPVP